MECHDRLRCFYGETDLVNKHLDAVIKKQTYITKWSTPTLECTPYLILRIMSYNACLHKNKERKNKREVKLLSSSSPRSVTGSASDTPHSFDWGSWTQRKRNTWISAMKTGLNSGSLTDWCLLDRSDSIVEVTTWSVLWQTEEPVEENQA